MLTDELVAEATRRLATRVSTSGKEVGERYPLAADLATGRWADKPDGSWTDGFWPAVCWLAEAVTGESELRQRALIASLNLRSRENTQTHDIGFLFYYGAVAGWRASGNLTLRAMALRAADNLAGMWHPRGRVITVGSHAEVSSGLDDVTIDCLMNLQLLWWAADETGDNRYHDIALAHAERTAEWHVRPDGSCFQSVHFDPDTGDPVVRHTHQGWSADGCWSRGVAWCCYGFLEAYHATKREEFLELARRALDYHIRRTPDDAVTFNDYDDPRIPDAPRDTSAAAILASAAVGLAALGTSAADRARDGASRLLEGLIRGYLTPIDPDDPRPAGMLLHGCYNAHSGEAPDHELIWGDYYLLEALMRWARLAGHDATPRTPGDAGDR